MTGKKGWKMCDVRCNMWCNVMYEKQTAHEPVKICLLILQTQHLLLMTHLVYIPIIWFLITRVKKSGILSFFLLFFWIQPCGWVLWILVCWPITVFSWNQLIPILCIQILCMKVEDHRSSFKSDRAQIFWKSSIFPIMGNLVRF